MSWIIGVRELTRNKEEQRRRLLSAILKNTNRNMLLDEAIQAINKEMPPSKRLTKSEFCHRIRSLGGICGIHTEMKSNIRVYMFTEKVEPQSIPIQSP